MISPVESKERRNDTETHRCGEHLDACQMGWGGGRRGGRDEEVPIQRPKAEGEKNTRHENGNGKKNAGVAVLTPDKTGFKTKAIARRE